MRYQVWNLTRQNLCQAESKETMLEVELIISSSNSGKHSQKSKGLFIRPEADPGSVFAWGSNVNGAGTLAEVKVCFGYTGCCSHHYIPLDSPLLQTAPSMFSNSSYKWCMDIVWCEEPLQSSLSTWNLELNSKGSLWPFLMCFVWV